MTINKNVNIKNIVNKAQADDSKAMNVAFRLAVVNNGHSAKKNNNGD